MVRRIVPYLIGVCMISLTIHAIHAQSGAASTSVYKTLYTGKQTPGASVVVPNIGQVGNQVFVNARNAPGKTCLPQNIQLNASLQFSYNNVDWINFGSPTGGVDQLAALDTGQLAGRTYFGPGIFPQVRFFVNNFDTVNCVIDAYYTGSSNSAQLASSTVFTRTVINSQEDPLQRIVFKRQPITVVGMVGNEGEAVPVSTCEGYFSGITPASGSVRISDGSQGGTFICYMLVTTAGANATFQIVSGQGALCTTGQQAKTAVFNVNSNGPVQIGVPNGMLMDMGTADPLCVVVTGGPVSVMIGVGQH